MVFNIILIFSAFSLAICAAFFSIKGIALLFAASFYSAAIMAAILELAKLVSVSYLYRYWKDINKFFKYYMLTAVILLMIITSLGVFGFLSNAFQKNFSQYSLTLNKIQSLKSQQAFILSQTDFNKNKLKDLIELQKTYQISFDSVAKQDVTTTKSTQGGLFASAKTEKVTDSKLLDSKNKIIEGSQKNINSLFNQIETVTINLQDLEKQATKISQDVILLESDNTKGEIGTLKFVAEAFNLKIETAVKIFILLIVIVFDPLAASLIIACNSLAVKNSNKEYIIQKEIIEKPIEKIVNTIKYQMYKRGTKKPHNPNLADPNLKSNLD